MTFTRKGSTYAIVEEASYGTAATGNAISITAVSGLGTNAAVLTAAISGVSAGQLVYVYKTDNVVVKYIGRVSVAVSGTSVTVDDSKNLLSAAGVSGGSTWVVQKTLFSTTDQTQFCETTDFTLTPIIAEIKRKVVNNSFVASESLLGEQTSSGSIKAELIPVQDALSGINSTQLLKNGMGRVVAGDLTTTPKTTTISGATSTTTNLVVTSSASFTAGQVIKVGSEYTTIESITDGTHIVVRPALNAAPADTTAVTALQTFLLSQPSDAQKTLSIYEHIGNSDMFIYSGVIVNGVEITVPVADILEVSYDVAGSSFSAGTNKVADTTPTISGTPFVGKNATFTVGSTAYCARDVKISVKNAVYDARGICATGISNKYVTEKSELMVSFTIDYSDSSMADFVSFEQGATGALWLDIYTAEGKHFIVYAPKVKKTALTKGVDSMVYTFGVSAQMLSSGTVSSYEDALIIGIGR